jgi:hypothetical protein
MLLNVRQNGFILLFPPDFFSDRVKEKYKKYYLDEYVIPMDSIWVDLPGFGVVTSSKELLDYPTQKPEKLVERLVEASS